MKLQTMFPDHTSGLLAELDGLEGSVPTVEDYQRFGRSVSELHLDAHDSAEFEAIRDVTNEGENTLLALAHRDEEFTTEHMETLTALFNGEVQPDEADLPTPSLEAFQAVAMDDDLQQLCEELVTSFMS